MCLQVKTELVMGSDGVVTLHQATISSAPPQEEDPDYDPKVTYLKEDDPGGYLGNATCD